MTVSYEWTVEWIDEHDDIYNSDFCQKLKGFKRYVDLKIQGKTDDEDTVRVDIGLVIDDANGNRSWAYLWMDGDTLKLPDHSEDSFGRPKRKIPKRFHDELAKVLAKPNKATA